MAKHAQPEPARPPSGRRRGKTLYALVSVGALAAGLVTALAPSASATDTNNLIVNGDFATPPVTSSFSTVGTGGSLGAWTVDSGSVDLVSQNFWDAPAGDPATTQTVDLSGSDAGSISQPVTLVPRAFYHVTYQYAGNPDGVAIKTGWVKVASPGGSASAQLKFDTTGRSASDMGWKQGGFTFLNQGADATVSAYSTTPGAFGPVITDLSMTLVPPPVITSSPDIHVLQTTPAGTAVDYTTPTATDPNDGDAPLTVTCSQDSGTVFPVGTTAVTCKARATTAPFQTASTSFTVTVSPVVSDCRARALAFDGSRPIQFGMANAAETPCSTSSVTDVAAKIVVVKGIPLLRIPDTGITAGVLNGRTTTTSITPTSASVSASASVANVSVDLLGVSIQLTGVQSSASSTVNGSCEGTTSGSSSVGTLVVNGKSYVIGSKPFGLDLGLVKINLNQQVVSGNRIVQRAVFISGLNTEYDTAIGESIAGVSC